MEQLSSIQHRGYIDHANTLTSSYFLANAVNRQTRAIISDTWYTDVKKLPVETAITFEEESFIRAFWEVDEKSLVELSLWSQSGKINIKVAGATHQDATKTVLDLHQHFLERPKEDEGMLSMTFWNMSGHGPHSLERRLSSHKWEDISQNYTSKVAHELQTLVELSSFSEENGKLMLFHGQPGTGKTHVLRALVESWKSWATAEYIVDPEQFFSDSSYMMKVIMQDSDDSDLYDFHIFDDEEEIEKNKKSPKWRLLICEDTGELLSKDANARSGQGLSRCLNLVDGFIGQGLRVLLLITTNEKLDALHPAVSRQGRTYATIQFDELTEEEASEWLGRPVKGKKSLAELYALKNEHDNNSKKNSGTSRPMGFIV